MVRIAVLGTCVGQDIVAKARDAEWKIVKSLVSYSLTAIVDSYGAQAGKFLNDALFSGEKRKPQDLLADLNGELLSAIAQAKPDLVLIDLADFRLAERIIELENGTKVYHTLSAYSQQSLQSIDEAVAQAYGSKVRSVRIKTGAQLTDEELREYLARFMQIVYQELGKERVLFFCSYLATQYLENGEVKRMASYMRSGNTNLFLERLSKALPAESEVMPYAKHMIGDTACNSAFEFHYCEPYYAYMAAAMRLKLQMGAVGEREREALLESCNEGIHRLYNEIFCRELLAKVRAKVKAKSVCIVPIAKSTQFAELLKSELDEDVYDYIYYDENADLDAIEARIRELKAEEPHCFFVIPELFYHGPGKGLSRVMYNADCLEGVDYAIYITSYFLRGFIGYYHDIYNNYINSKSECSITIKGGGGNILIKTTKIKNAKIHANSNSEIVFEDDSKGHDLRIRSGVCGIIRIGQRSSIGDAHIVAHSLAILEIGKDCLFSWGEMLFSGDGHAIFEVIDTNKNNKRVNSFENDKIIVGNHVWLGYRCHILSGADIGDGCIVGAGSLVNKKVPNNCIIAGVPGRIIKKNRAWSGNSNYKNIRFDKRAFEKYTNLTQGEDNEQ